MVRLSKNVGAGVTASVEGESFTEAFEQMAMIEECYEACPLEQSNGSFRHRVRDVEKDGKEYRYYELMDIETKARLSLGQYDQKDKKGFLFPKRKASAEKGGEWLPNRGWEVWAPQNAAKPAQEKSKSAPTKKNTSAKVANSDDELPF